MFMLYGDGSGDVRLIEQCPHSQWLILRNETAKLLRSSGDTDSADALENMPFELWKGRSGADGQFELLYLKVPKDRYEEIKVADTSRYERIAQALNDKGNPIRFIAMDIDRKKVVKRLTASSEKGWWERPPGIVALSVAGGLIVWGISWGISRHYDKVPSPSIVVEQPKAQPQVQLKTPQASPPKAQEPQALIRQSGRNNHAVGNVSQSGNCNVIQNGSGNQASPNCAPEWHLDDVQRGKWSDFAATLPPQAAGLIVVSDISDKNSREFASDIFGILNEHHKVNREGELISGHFVKGVTVQVHDEADTNVPLAKSIIEGMKKARIPVADDLSFEPTINNHEVHIIVGYMSN
jgi:hypothetical protein